MGRDAKPDGARVTDRNVPIGDTARTAVSIRLGMSCSQRDTLTLCALLQSDRRLLIGILDTYSRTAEAVLRLTFYTDYGLRMLMRMASAPERAFSTAQLAAELELSRHHLTKIMQRLAQVGIVSTRRGNGGGAQLARQPREINLAEIVRVLEAGQPLVECFARDGGHCTLDGRCRLKGKLRNAQTAFMNELNHSTLADIAIPANEAV